MGESIRGLGTSRPLVCMGHADAHPHFGEIPGWVIKYHLESVGFFYPLHTCKKC